MNVEFLSLVKLTCINTSPLWTQHSTLRPKKVWFRQLHCISVFMFQCWYMMVLTNVCDFPPVNTGFQFMHGLIYTGFVYSEFYDHIHIILDYPECDTHNILLIQAWTTQDFGLFRVQYIQDFGWFRVQYTQDFSLFWIQYKQDFGLFRAWIHT